MPITGSFGEALKCHNKAIEFGREGLVKKGNRCAMVTGMALHLKPNKDKKQITMRDLNTTDHAIRNKAKQTISAVFSDGKYDESVTGPDQPFMDNFFVKAKDLADAIIDKFGAPDVSGDGKKFLGLESWVQRV